MTPPWNSSGRVRGMLAAGALVLVLIAALFGPRLWNWVRGLRYTHGLESAQNMDIPGGGPGPSVSASSEPDVRTAAGPSYIAAVSADRRYFVDQYGKPVLVRGDSPWSLMTRMSPEQALTWFANRERNGFNAAIVSLIGTTANGGPDDSGRTFDGIHPFVEGDVTRWNGAYWSRVHSYLEMAADHGITVFLYPIDGWTIGGSFMPTSIEQCRSYGAKVAAHVSDLPNVVWMSGGDYFPKAKDPAHGSDVDHCIDALMQGIRATGDHRPFSIQLGYNKSLSTDNPFWASRVDWNFVYTYYPTYKAVLDAYVQRPPLPAIMGEANYEGENNQPDTPMTTDETLRRQVLWALTSGAAGDFMGSQDWRLREGWQKRLDTAAVGQLDGLHRLIGQLPWWQLVPDIDEAFVTGGRGTRLTADEAMDVLDNDYVSEERAADGRVAVVYVPTQRTITIDRTKLASDVAATWVDPASGAKQPAALADTFTTPGANAGGTNDWLLLFTTTPTQAG